MTESDKPASGERRPARPVPEQPRPKVKARRPPPVEETPVISGRLLTAAGIIGALTILPMSPIGATLEPKEPPRSDTSKWKVGEKSTIRLTLVTADYATLSCAADKAFEGKHCINKSESEAWPREPDQALDDNKANIIQPYRTWLDNRLILVAGLWATPALAMRLHIEPPGNLLPEKLARFVTECEVRFVGELEKPKLRWGAAAAWNADPNTPMVPVAVPESCKVIPEPSEPCPEGAICALLTRL